MFTKLKLKERIFIGYSIPVVLVLGFSGLSYATGYQLSEAFKQVNRSQKVIQETDEMVLRNAMMARQVRGYLLIKGSDPLSEFAKQKKLYQQAVDRVDTLILEPEQREIFLKMLRLADQYDNLCRETFRLVDEGRQKEAVNLYLMGSKKLIGAIDKLNEDFNVKQQKLLQGYIESTNVSIGFLIFTAAITSLLATSLSAAAAFLIWSTIAKTNQTINQTVNAIISSSTEIAATVDQQERSATQQATSVNETTTTMNQLGTSSTATAEQAESSAQNARQVLNLAESSVKSAHQVLNLADGGTQAVERTIEGMSALKHKVEDIAQQILRLHEQTRQIGNITNLVSDLANQTNMLALNAAVEAVRAGEHGKGFAVVASEIRKLADQSKTSAYKINNLIEGIQSAINSTVIVTDEGKKNAEEGIKVSQETAEAFAKVAQAISEIILSNQESSLMAMNEVVLNSQKISLNTKQQALAIQQVVQAMNLLNQAANQTASGITQTKVGMQTLNEAALNLKGLV